jgi:type II secretory pathway predicted ATPase ExeA
MTWVLIHTEQKKKLLKAKIAVALHDELGRAPKKEEINDNKTIVLIIDEAQTLRIPLLELLRQIINYETNDMKLLHPLFSRTITH